MAYRIMTAMAPQPVSRDEVAEYFKNLGRKRAVNPERKNASIVER